MRRVKRAFERAKDAGLPALMPYLTAGDPAEPSLAELLVAIAEAGADIIEVGIPYSDPIADGPVIASAMHRSLERGMTPASVFQEVCLARQRTEVALVAMVSDSIVSHQGRPEFVAQAHDAGFDGLIVPDADLDDISELKSACSQHEVTLTLLVAPSSSLERQREIAGHASGFLYLLARAGVTGERSEIPDIEPRITQLRTCTKLPIAVGFGISTAQQVASIGLVADGAIVGSALVRRLDDAFTARKDVAAEASSFISGLKVGLDLPQ